MEVGTKSVLWGVHAFWWHPTTVLIAWVKLYGIPNWKELVCIFIHDLGYWGKSNMDGADGETHPEYAAVWAFDHLDDHSLTSGIEPMKWDVPGAFRYFELCAYHSRTTAKNCGKEPSKLCWADKLSIKYDPWWFYLLRAKLSGEIHEYIKDAIALGGISEKSTEKEWFMWARARGITVAQTRDPARAYDTSVM